MASHAEHIVNRQLQVRLPSVAYLGITPNLSIDKILAEFCYRFNLASLAPRLVYASVRTPLLLYRLLTLAEVCR